MKAVYTISQLKKMSSRTDCKRLIKMRDKDIDYYDSPDVSELLKSGQVRRIERSKTVPKKQVSLRLDAEIIAGFKRTGSNWQVRINNNLREWLEWRQLL